MLNNSFYITLLRIIAEINKAITVDATSFKNTIPYIKNAVQNGVFVINTITEKINFSIKNSFICNNTYIMI